MSLIFLYFPTRNNFDSKDYVKQNSYTASSYEHHPNIEDFWEDCIDEGEVQRRSFMRLTLKNIQNFDISFNIPKDVEEDSVIIDLEYQAPTE